MLPEYIEALKQAKLNKKAIIRQTKRLRKMRKGAVDDLIHPLNDAAFEKVDCLACANCCKSIPPIVNKTDAKRISKFLGLKVTVFKEDYMKTETVAEFARLSKPRVFT